MVEKDLSQLKLYDCYGNPIGTHFPARQCTKYHSIELDYRVLRVAPPPSFLLPSIMWYTNSHLHQITLLDQSFLLALQPSDAIISCFLSTFQLMHLGSVFLQFVTHTTIMCFPVAGLIATSTNSIKMYGKP